MSASLTGLCLPPSSNLIPVRKIIHASTTEIELALKSLQSLYCPLRLPTAISPHSTPRKVVSVPSTPLPVDSGYASQDEDEDNDAAHEQAIASLRADPFERTFATRWLTSLISRVEEMDVEDETRSQIVDSAAFILASFSDDSSRGEEQDLTRDFSFPCPSSDAIKITLNDAPLSGTDHTDVGLQSWGASIVLSDMMCAEPQKFSLTPKALPEIATIIELGAGTGLVSLTLAKLLPSCGLARTRITATDYHPAVLENCKTNIASNWLPSSDTAEHLDTMILDWSQPPPALRCTADLLIASDVVYAPEHATWLRDCAAHLIKPNGTFWLMVTVRKTGKFEGIPDTVEAAFMYDSCPQDSAGRRFRILEKEAVDKRRGIGRGDEAGYNLFRIGWA